MPNLKIDSSLLTFTEVPDEISLCLNISNCPHRCKNCFEPWLREDRGEILDVAKLKSLFEEKKYATCICFMGGDANHAEIIELCKQFKLLYPSVKFAMYSGDDEEDQALKEILDYYKIGHYDEECGPLNSPTTNQKFLKKDINDWWLDITYRFRKKE